MKVKVTSLLTQYTNGERIIELSAGSVNEALDQLDKKFPGIKFRFMTEEGSVRDHMSLFLNKIQVRSLDTPTNEDDELFIVQALSGG